MHENLGSELTEETGGRQLSDKTISTAPDPSYPARRGLVAGGLGAGADGVEA